MNQGWRLTHSGFQAVSAHYIHYSVTNDQNHLLTGKILINMDNCVGGPWFLRGATVYLFDQTVGFELQMFGGDLHTFVDFKRSK